MLIELKREAYEANLLLLRHGLVHLNFGNASALDRPKGIFAIKPSGVDYAALRPRDMVLVDLRGRRVEGSLRPSTDTPTHAELYRGFAHIGGVVHTHSLFATAFAQAGREISVLGTTHADFFRGPIPLTRPMRTKEIREGYEFHTGRVILERFVGRSPEEIGAVLVYRHGPFAWGKTAAVAAENAVAVEFCAQAACHTLRLDPRRSALAPALLDFHFRRKHGPAAYYGQIPLPQPNGTVT